MQRLRFFIQVILIGCLAILQPGIIYAATQYYYDANHRLMFVKNDADQMTEFIYDANGNLMTKSSSNLLMNGNFELYTNDSGVGDGWSNGVPAGAAYFFQIEPSTHGGNHAQRITAERLPPGTTAWVYQYLNIKGGQPYSLSGQFRIDVLKDAVVQLHIDFLDAQGQYIGYGKTELSSLYTNYTTMHVDGTTPAKATRAIVYAIIRSTGSNGIGSILVDGLRLQYGQDLNLVSNGGFEENRGKYGVADGWYYAAPQTSTAQFQVEANGIRGSQSQKIAVSGLNPGEMALIYQYVQVDPGKPYAFDGQIRIDMLANSKLQFQLDFLDANGQYIATGQINELTTPYSLYTSMHLDGIVPKNAVRAIVHAIVRSTGAGGAATIYVDEMRLSYQSDKNQLNNGSFETYGAKQIADGWYRSIDYNKQDAYKLENKPAKGNKAQRITASELGAGETAWVYQYIKAEPGKAYTLSGQFLIESLKNANIQLHIDFLNAQGQYIGYSKAERSTTSTDYVTMQTKGTVPAGATRAIVYAIVRATQNGGAGSFLVDDLKLVYH